MRITTISDQHGHLPEIPECDVLVIAGDICPVRDHSYKRQRDWLDIDFRYWLEAQSADHIVGIAGNHDFIYDDVSDSRMATIIAGDERSRVAPPDDLPWTYLQDNGTYIDGVTFYGVPWTPWFGGWAFNTLEEQEEDIWSSVPPCDVLISHGPPHGILDITPDKDRPGSTQMLKYIDKRIKPALSVFGHIHGPGGRTVIRGDTRYVNASVVDEFYDLTQKILQFDLIPYEDRYMAMPVLS